VGKGAKRRAHQTGDGNLDVRRVDLTNTVELFIRRSSVIESVGTALRAFAYAMR
jgi:hypothetical protein